VGNHAILLFSLNYEVFCYFSISMLTSMINYMYKLYKLKKWLRKWYQSGRRDGYGAYEFI